MPFKSRAQRRKFAEFLVKGEITPETFEDWNRETGRRRLAGLVGWGAALAGLRRARYCAPAPLRDPRGRSAVPRPEESVRAAAKDWWGWGATLTGSVPKGLARGPQTFQQVVPVRKVQLRLSPV